VGAKKAKKVQKDLDGNDVSPVSVTNEPVSYVKKTFVTDKFKVVAKDCDIDEAEDLEDLVRDKIRPLKGAFISAGDYDAAVADILKRLQEGM